MPSDSPQQTTRHCLLPTVYCLLRIEHIPDCPPGLGHMLHAVRATPELPTVLPSRAAYSSELGDYVANLELEWSLHCPATRPLDVSV